MRRECPLERLYFIQGSPREPLEKGALDCKMLGKTFPGRGASKYEGLHQNTLGFSGRYEKNGVPGHLTSDG